MPGITKIHYYHVGLSSFVEKDIAILQSHFSVHVHYFPLQQKWRIPFLMGKQLLQLLMTKKRNTATVTQFGGFHSFIPSLVSRFTRLKSIIVLGGTDCVAFPSIGYGNFNRKALGWATKQSFLKADLLLPVHESLVYYPYTYQDKDGSQQGYQAFIPGIQTAFEVIFNGYDDQTWTIGDGNREQLSYVTVGFQLNSRFGKQLKGIDLLLEGAQRHPECRFYIVGGKGLKEDIPENVILMDKIPNKDLNGFLQSKTFYLQLSLSEGFPNALSEAMLSGCIPIVSAVGGMPDIIGDQGYLLTRKSIELLDGLINESKSLSPDQLAIAAQKSHEQIAKHFSLELRRNKLIAAILK